MVVEAVGVEFALVCGVGLLVAGEVSSFADERWGRPCSGSVSVSLLSRPDGWFYWVNPRQCRPTSASWMRRWFIGLVMEVARANGLGLRWVWRGSFSGVMGPRCDVLVPWSGRLLVVAGVVGGIRRCCHGSRD